MHKWNYFYISLFCLPDTQNKYESGGLHYTVYTMPESKKLIFIDISPLVFPQVFRYIIFSLYWWIKQEKLKASIIKV